MASADLMAQLAAAALIGTERAGQWPDLEGDLSTLVSSRTGTSREENFLTATAVLDVYRRAGMVPDSHTKETSTAPPDVRPRTSRPADQMLGRLLAGTFVAVLPEWLFLRNRANQRPWERQLPDLLDFAVRETTVREAVAAAIDARGTWLAAQHPEWRHIVSPRTDDKETWETGSRAERTRALHEARDRDPAAGRAMLEQVWPSEGPEERAAFIAVLSHKLSQADGPFLEFALDDKRKEVREAAADLLARLPESRLALRMIERMAGLAKLKKGILRKTTLEIEPPAEATKEMQRDGLSAKQIAGLGAKASLLARLIGATPLRFWTQTRGLAAEDLLQAVAKSEWLDAIGIGLAEAAARERSTAFAAALLSTWVLAKKDEDLRGLDDIIASLVAVLDPAAREAMLSPLMTGKKNLLDRGVLLSLLKAATHPWSLPFSQTFIAVLLRYARTGNDYVGYQGSQAVSNHFGLYAHPDLAPILAERLKTEEGLQSQSLEQFLAMIQFRHEMHKEFRT